MATRATSTRSNISPIFPTLLFEHLPKGWANGVASELARLIVGALQCGKLALAAKPGVRNRSLQHPDRLAVDRSRHRKAMPVLAAMGDGKPPANSGYRVAPSQQAVWLYLCFISATDAEDLLAGTGTPDQARHCDLAFSKL